MSDTTNHCPICEANAKRIEFLEKALEEAWEDGRLTGKLQSSDHPNDRWAETESFEAWYSRYLKEKQNDQG